MGTVLEKYPFHCVFSLRPLIEFWRRNVAAGFEHGSCLAEGLEAKLQKAPELLEPIEDLIVLDRHQDLLKSFPEGYRHLAYLQHKIGYKVKTDMPGIEGPALDALYARGARWLSGAAL